MSGLDSPRALRTGIGPSWGISLAGVDIAFHSVSIDSGQQPELVMQLTRSELGNSKVKVEGGVCNQHYTQAHWI